MLVTLKDMKDYLGIDCSNCDYDSFLNEQICVISEAVENYCGRKFLQKRYTQTFYYDEFKHLLPVKELALYHYPVSKVVSVEIEDEAVDITTYRIKKDRGMLVNTSLWFGKCANIEVKYIAGFAEVPLTIQACVKSLVQEKYNKKISGVDINFGQDVQQISIPGSINIAFDYTLQANDRSSKFGMILGNWANVLDPYRSERVVQGTIEGSDYVE